MPRRLSSLPSGTRSPARSTEPPGEGAAVTPALILECFDEPVSFHRAYARMTGSVTAALLLTLAVDWSYAALAPHEDGSGEEEGWFERSQEAIQEATCLSRWELETARRKLRELGLLEERRVGMPAKLQMRVLGTPLAQRLNEQADSNWGAHLAQAEAQESPSPKPPGKRKP